MRIGDPIRLGNLSLVKRNYGKAVEYFKRSLQQELQRRNATFLFADYTGLGHAFEGLNEHGKARENYENAIAMVEQQRETLNQAEKARFFAAELVNKFLKERAPIRAISLTTDTSSLTSIANDISYDYVFSRQIEALGDKEDVALGLSTSGSSPNVMEAMKVAKERGLLTVAFTGKGGGKLNSLVDYLLDVSSESTPRIQEVHLLLLHLLAEEIEKRLE